MKECSKFSMKVMPVAFVYEPSNKRDWNRVHVCRSRASNEIGSNTHTREREHRRSEQHGANAKK